MMVDAKDRTDIPIGSGLEYELIVPGGYGRAFKVQTGQHLMIRDVEGQQIGDFLAFNAHDVTEYLHTAHTRVSWGRIYPRVGDVIITNWLTPMLAIVRDDVGQHDLVRAMCNPKFYLRDFGVANHRSCFENCAEVLEPYGVARWWMPMPLNIFQNTPVTPDGRYELLPAASKAGDSIVFRAQMDLICALSACPAEMVPCNGFKITDLKVAVSNLLPGP